MMTRNDSVHRHLPCTHALTALHSSPVCHIADTAELYPQLLRKLVSDDELGYDEHGFFLASSGHPPRTTVYSAMAKSLAGKSMVPRLYKQRTPFWLMDIPAI
ncbi:uncharacterized protein BDW43DRAFT_283707 [Aspergillus alliaceus]|uniref:uncharacterized protein n=1 Tax=Petromyces alliaceus TaxID=209559 RepID=UPI0012A5D5E6|nr:uncharacterized protein BDW43DRAFT_283707 [Aspergillus alliaceus]KAB8230904.1 hypothetical protein BDW43DRAFT_283707 [Aspergillus alliaceus]